MFCTPIIEHPAKKRSPGDTTIFTADISTETRKPLSEVALKGLRVRLAPLLKLINQIAEKEEVDAKTIATYTLHIFRMNRKI